MLQRLLQTAFWLAALFALVMAALPQPPRLPTDPSDKVQHLLAFATLAALGVAAFPRATLVRILVGLSLFGAGIELIQMIPQIHREASMFDWLADTAAAAVILGAVFAYRRTSAAGRSGPVT